MRLGPEDYTPEEPLPKQDAFGLLCEAMVALEAIQEAKDCTLQGLCADHPSYVDAEELADLSTLLDRISTHIKG